MKKIISILLSGLAMVSCIDTVILPDNKTVEEDFWQTKGDVAMMVNGAYSGLVSSNLMQRFVVWTMRADELNLNLALNNSNLNQIYSANIQTTNSYCSWGDLYSIINNCNLVLDKSAEVMSIDPNYMEGDHMNNIGQMKALRALCYFYLVRVFRDVPLILEPYKFSSQEMNVPQVAPSVVIDQIIADLEEAKGMVLSSAVIRDGSDFNYFTSNGVLALLADVYLWKASIYGDEYCYDKCIECCDAIRATRQIQYGYQGSASTLLDDGGFGLNLFNSYIDNFLPKRNTGEFLFAISGIVNAEGICIVYHKNKDNSNALPQFYASPVYSKTGTDRAKTVFDNKTQYAKDIRGFESVYDFNNESADEGFFVRKFVAQQSVKGNEVLTIDGTPVSEVRDGARAYKNYEQNWIFYRISDVILMKAEALVQKAVLKYNANAALVDELKSSNSLEIADQLAEVGKEISSALVGAARCAQIVNARANTTLNSTVIDSTQYAETFVRSDAVDSETYASDVARSLTKLADSFEALELIVMDERARELCFEGKRWFDMLRYNYRHTTGVDYGTILAQQGGGFAKNYEEMLELVARKYVSGEGDAVKAKMPTEPFLYMPISQSEMDVNSALMQNPVYSEGNTMEKN